LSSGAGGATGTINHGGAAGGGLALDVDAGDCDPDPTCSNDLIHVVDCKGQVLATCGAEEGCVGGKCIPNPCAAAEASQSSYGCDYWALKTALRPQADGACFAAFVTNTWAKPVHIQVERGGQKLPDGFIYVPVTQGQEVNYAPYDPVNGLPPGQVAILFLARSPFGGSVVDLMHAREAVDIPVLRKDFTIDDIQVYEARGIGADAVLLICSAIPDDAQLADLHSLALDLSLGVLVEVHDDAELDRALAIDAAVIGINSRNLGTFVEDLGVAESIAARVPSGSIAVAESAIRSTGDVTRMAGAGFDAVLVGEALVRSEDPTATMQAFAGVARRDGGR